MKELALKAIRAYQLSFSYRWFPRCKHHPSCSEYTMLAIEKHGFFFGVAKSVWRILRCNPLSKGGVDLP